MPSPYSVGVDLSLATNAPQVLALMSRQLLGLHGSVNQLTQGFAALRMGVIGAAMALTGKAIIGGLDSLADKGKELLHQQEMMRLQGWKQVDMVNTMNQAWKISGEVTSTTASENLKHIRELAYATGSMTEAIEILPEVAKANAILTAMKGGGKDEVWNLVKALEEKGLLNLSSDAQKATFFQYVSDMTKAVEASGGRVTPSAFQSTFIFGRSARLGWDEEFITQILPRLIQSMSTGGGGGSGQLGPGNALMSAFAKVVQGQTTKTAGALLKSYGLADVEEIEGASQSKYRVHGASLFTANPYEWVQQFLMPALAAHGVTQDQDIIQKVSSLFPVRTASDILAQMGLMGYYHLGREASPFEKDRRLTLQAMEESQAYRSISGGDPFQILLAYNQQWKAMEEAIGVPLLQMKLDVIQALTPLFTSLAQFARENPETVKNVAKFLAGLSVALVGLGTIAVGAAVAQVVAGVGLMAALPWAALGLGVIAAAVAIIDHWPQIKAWFQSLPSMIGSWAADLPGKAGKAISDAFEAISGYISRGINSLWEGIKSLSPISYSAPLPNHGGVTDARVVVPVYLDGRVITQVVAERLARSSTFQTSVGGQDTRGTWLSPGAMVSA